MSKMKLELLLQSVDKASPGVKKLAAEVERSNKRITQSTERKGRAEEKAAQRGMTAARRAATARQRLGVRSEHHVRREIQRTQAAYNRLARSGTASADDISRAYAKMTQRVQRLNTELGRVSRSQKLIGRAKMTGAIVGGVAAGATAGAMMLREPVRRQMSYDRQLAMVANTAYSERGVDGRIAGKAELAAAVKTAVETGGGSKAQALSALDTLLASGSMPTKTALSLLPTLQKGAVATGSSTDDLSKIAISAMQQFSISDKDIGKVLDMAVAAGQAGNFELADMARWLPQQMAAAKQAGMGGMDGYAALLVANQQARVTAGSSDEAGNNLVNFLAKLTSKETNERFKKINYRDSDGKIKGVDFLGSMEKGKAEGKNSIEAFMGILDKVVGSDKRYQDLQAKLKNADKNEQQSLLSEMTNLVEGTALGRIISDRQALMAMIGIRNNEALGNEVAHKIGTSAGSTDVSHAVVAATDDFKFEQAKNAFEEGQSSLMQGFNSFLGDASKLFSDWAKENPTANKAVSGGATAVGAVAASGAVYAGSKKLLTRGTVTTAAGAATASGIRGGAVAARGAASRGILSRANIPLLAVLGIMQASKDGNWQKQALSERKNNKAYGGAMMRAELEKPATGSVWQQAGQRYPRQSSGSTSKWTIAAGAQAVAAQQRELQIQQFQQALVSEGITAKTPELNEHVKTLASDLSQRTDATNAAIQAMASQPIVIQQTNQVHIDGAVVSETVSRHQGNRLSRGSN